VAPFADEINNSPMFFALLHMREVQISQFAASKSAAKQHCENRTVPLSFESVHGGGLPEAPGLIGR
jgi:hypothetical protein